MVMPGMVMTILREHPERRQIVEEMHLRRWPAICAPCLIFQILLIVDDDDRAQEKALLATPPAGAEFFAQDNPKHREGRLGGGIGFVWEQHSEATAVTLFVPNPRPEAMVRPEDITGLPAAMAWAQALPGQVIRATQILVAADEEAACLLLPAMAFSTTDLVSCHIGAGQGARIWSDFRIAKGGFGRLLVAANGMAGGDLARLVQRMQELGNYRNLAVLGLPVAQAYWDQLRRIEGKLNSLAQSVASAQSDDEVLLEHVTTFSLELMSISTATNYRLGATAAYAQLVEERLSEIAPRPIAGFQSLKDFTQRRLMPAVRTCASHVRREQELSVRADRFSSLLRTRVETKIERQNAQLLASMQQSASLQLRLQQLAEGFSVVAVSYYLIALLSYVLKGFEKSFPEFDEPRLVAMLVPAAVLGMWLVIHRLKRRVFSPPGVAKMP